MTNTPADDCWPDWTSDGRNVLFIRDKAPNCCAPTASAGSGTLVTDNWGEQPDSFARAPGPWRVFIEPSGSDWGGANPPLGANRPLALVGFDAQRLSTALSCVVAPPQSSGVIEPVQDTGERVVVAKVSGTSGVSQVWEDNGPGVPVTKIVVEQSDGKYAGSILLVFAAETGRLSSVIPLHEEAWTTAAGQEGVWAERKGSKLLLHAPAEAVYVAEPGGQVRNLAPGGATLVVLNSATGTPLGVQ